MTADQPRALTLHEDLALEAAHHHLPEQAKRFARIFAYTLGAQILATGGWHVTGWTGLWSLLAGTAEIAFRQWRKTMRVTAAQQVAAEHDTAAPPAAPPGAPTPGR